MQAFIAMPFDPVLDEVHKAIREACKYAGFTPIRADDIYQPGVIVSQIYEGIQKSDCVVGVLTGKNPNVYYELGIAHGLSTPLILLHPQGTLATLPFDIKHNRVIPYIEGKAKDVIPQIQAQLDFIKGTREGKITPEEFVKNIDLNKDDIDRIRKHLEDLGLTHPTPAGMELLEQGKGVLLRFESAFGEKLVVLIDSNRMITRIQKL